MFVGHALLAFALAALAARRWNWTRERALTAGFVAGAFAALPDVDIVYAPVGVVGASGARDAANGFWAASTLIHRGLTHSLVIAAVAAIGFAAWAAATRADVPRDDFTQANTAPWRRAWRPGLLVRGGGVVLSLCLVAIGFVTSGALGGVVMAVFVVAGLVVTTAAMHWSDLSARALLVLAAFGLASHPFGDLFTGQPPAFFAPFDVTLVAHRLSLSADPTLQVLGAFWIELGVVWLAAIVYCRLTERRSRDHVRGRAVLGLAYAGVALLITPPTLDHAYRFVFSVLAVGLVGPAPLVWRVRALRRAVSSAPSGSDGDRAARTSTGSPGAARPHATRWRQGLDAAAIEGGTLFTALLTGLAAITLAALAYTTTYLLT